MATTSGIEIRGHMDVGYDEVLTPDALEFVAELQRRFGARREELLKARAARRERLRAGEMLDFLPDTRDVREGDWKVEPVPADLVQRWVELTGPTDRKMVINALNSGADGFMADFEDANSPTWRNMVLGHVNLRDAIERTICYDAADGRRYELGPDPATLLVRPRGWHLPERHLLVGGEPVSGSLFDFGLYFFHCAPRLLRARSGPYFYLPKLESRLEARLWNDVFSFAQEAAGTARGTIKATVLIETLPAAFEMDEILFELREHAAGLNAGRWDYIFSAIKCFPDRPEMVLPDRGDVKMTVPFMHAYTELLAATCHRRGAHAMGGMAALIPSRKDEEANTKALEGVRQDKEREVSQGYDGTWVAHPDLVPVAREVFERGLGGAPNQLGRLRDDVHVTAAELLDLASTPGKITEAGLHRRKRRVSVCVVLAHRSRCGGDQLADGGCRHRRDLTFSDLAVDPPWREARGWDDGHARSRHAGARRGDREDPRERGRGDMASGAPRRDTGDLRAGRPVTRGDRVPDDSRVRVSGLTRSPGRPLGARRAH